MSASDTPRTRDCPHGSLLRSCEICELREELTAARAEAEALRKDAERYRWLRDECGYYNNHPKDMWVGRGIYHTKCLSGDGLDRAIDAAKEQK